MTSDWKEVYRQEKKRPAYVIQNARMPRGKQQEESNKQEVLILRRAKKKAA